MDEAKVLEWIEGDGLEEYLVRHGKVFKDILGSDGDAKYNVDFQDI